MITVLILNTTRLCPVEEQADLILTVIHLRHKKATQYMGGKEGREAGTFGDEPGSPEPAILHPRKISGSRVRSPGSLHPLHLTNMGARTKHC